MNDFVTSIAPAHSAALKPQLNLDLWIRGSLSWFMQTQMEVVAEGKSTTENYLPTHWAQQLAQQLQAIFLSSEKLNAGPVTMAAQLHQLSLTELELSPGLQRLAMQGVLDKNHLFVLALCSALNDHYELNIALQALQGAQQQPWPRLYLLCDLVQTICGSQLSPSEMAAWYWVASGVLQLQTQGPLALAWVQLNNHYWQWLQTETVPTRNEFFSAINYSGNTDSAKKSPLTRLHTAEESCSDFAVAMRLGQLQQLHLCGSRSAMLAWVKRLAECLNKTPVLPRAECELHWLNLLCGAYELLPVIEVSAELNQRDYFSRNYFSYDDNSTSIPIIIWHAAPLSVAELTQLQQANTVAIHYLPASIWDERLMAWQQWVTPIQADEFARRWLISPDAIHPLATSVSPSAWHKPTAELRAAIAQARQQLAPDHLQSLAFLVPQQISANALVLSPKIHAELDALQIRCEQREQVYSDLGPAVAGAGHGGVKALLYGESGTGKTLAALYLASQLAAPVYRLDLGAVLNKYIGETEKNIHQLMLEAAAGDFILLIDEADALFAKRGDGDSGGERFANMLTNYLLARIEQHPGIVLMTTNGLGRIDGAFMRRFDRVIEFHAPTLDERARLWQNHLGVRSPGEQVCTQLASLCDLSGGFIRNAVLAAAAELPVSEAPQLSFVSLLHAVAREYRKSGKPLPPKLLNQLNLAQPDKAVQA